MSSRIGFLLDRGKLNPNRIAELQRFGRAGKEFHLVVFPEGTRGDGVNVLPCQPGIHYIAQEARLPLVPVFFENMQLVSTKTGRFHHWRTAQSGSDRRTHPAGDLPRCREMNFDFVRPSTLAAKSAASVPVSAVLRPSPARQTGGRKSQCLCRSLCRNLVVSVKA